jgi:hypothetical protein
LSKKNQLGWLWHHNPTCPLPLARLVHQPASPNFKNAYDETRNMSSISERPRTLPRLFFANLNILPKGIVPL